MRAYSICFWSILEISIIFMIYCFLLFLDSTKTAQPKLPLPTILTFLYLSISLNQIITNQILNQNFSNLKSFISIIYQSYDVSIPAFCRIECIRSVILALEVLRNLISKCMSIISSFLLSYFYFITFLFLCTVYSKDLAVVLNEDIVLLKVALLVLS